MALQVATRKKAKIKIGISAPTGFGKTWSSLLLAYGLTGDWSKIAVIDSENESSILYSHLGEYLVWDMKPPYTVAKFQEAVKACIDAGVHCIIVDSTYHYWHGKGGLLEYNSSLTGGNSYTNWAKTNPLYNQWLDTILQSPAHFICTSRKKQAYEIVENNGKKTVEKKGMEDQIRDGFDYEMTVAFAITSADHRAESSKDRTSLFDGQQPFIITTETGKLIAEWCEKGIDVEQLEKERQERLLEAIQNGLEVLSECKSQEEIKALKGILPEEVTTDPAFKSAANAKYKELTPAPQPVEQL